MSVRALARRTYTLSVERARMLALFVVASVAVNGLFRMGTLLANDLLVQTFLSLSNLAVSAVLGLVATRISLAIVRGESYSTAQWFDDLAALVPYVAATLIYGAIVLAGLCLFIVPGIIWALRYSQYRYALLDLQLGVFEALTYSAVLTRGHLGSLLVIFVAVVLFNVLGALFFGVGLVVTAALSLVAMGVLYDVLLNDERQSNSSLPTNNGRTDR